MNDKRIIADVPAVLPLLAAQPDGKVVFPGMPIRIFNCEELPQQPFCVVSSFWDGQPMSNTGVIGEIIRVERNQEKIFYFHGITRVYFRIENKRDDNIFVRWMLFDEINNLAKTQAETKELKKRVEQMRVAVKHYIAIILRQSESKTKEFLKDGFAVSALERIANVNSETLIAVCDDIMNIANAVSIPESDTVYIHYFSEVILAEKFYHIRFFLVREYLDTVLNGNKKTSARNIPISDGTDENKSEKFPAAVSGRKAIVESLAPREILPRQSAANSVPEPHTEAKTLDHKRESAFMKNCRAFLGRYVINQDLAQKQIVESLVLMKYRSPNSPEAERPIIGGMFLGPTGVGKTELVKTLAKFCVDDPRGYIHVPCSMLQLEHEKTRLIGAPPGYIGYDDVPYFSQWRIDRAHVISRLRKFTEKEFREIYQKLKALEVVLHEVKAEQRPAIYDKIQKLTGWIPGENIAIILFDEIEKAHTYIYQILLSVFDDGRFTLLNGETTIFKNAVIFFTSNLYGEKLMQEISGRGKIGFHAQDSDSSSMQEKFKKKLYKEVLREVEKHFRVCPEFLGRIGKENMIVCYPLEAEHYAAVLDLRIDEYETNLIVEYGLGRFIVSDAARRFFIAEALDPLNRALGVRAFNRVFDNVKKAVSILLDQQDESDKLLPGDWVYADTEINKNGEEKLIIRRKRPESASAVPS